MSVTTFVGVNDFSSSNAKDDVPSLGDSTAFQGVCDLRPMPPRLFWSLRTSSVTLRVPVQPRKPFPSRVPVRPVRRGVVMMLRFQRQLPSTCGGCCPRGAGWGVSKPTVLAGLLINARSFASAIPTTSRASDGGIMVGAS